MTSPLLLGLLVAAVPGIEPLAEEEVWQAVAALVEMKDNPRGPYQGVSWFCADGAVLPPKSYACRRHGGGVQHGVLGAKAVALGKKGLYVGTILASLSPAALLADDYYRARALIVERYLERALEGWVLRGSRGYRGFRQDEDEEAAARRLLLELMREPAFFDHRRHLAIRLMRALPYGRNSNLGAEIRALAGIIGDEDPRFAELRFKIHAMPEPTDVAAVQDYAAQASGALALQARLLVEKMRQHFDPLTRRDRLKDVSGWLRDAPLREAIDAFLAKEPGSAELIPAGVDLMRACQAVITAGQTPVQWDRNLLALHVIALVEEMWVGATAELSRASWTRAEALGFFEPLLDGARLTGILSGRERQSLQLVIERMRQGGRTEWVKGVVRLRRVLEWARARVLADLGLALSRYAQVEPRANAVVDDALRSGVMLPLAALLDRLSADADRLQGGGHLLLELPVATGVRGENAGLASGVLRAVANDSSFADLGRRDIVLLEALPPDLPPVAGIVTTGPAGSLSHVALLARNLGIPHAIVDAEVARGIAALDGQAVVLGVTVAGRVLFGAKEKLSTAQRRSLALPLDDGPPRFQLEVERLDLTTARLLPLGEVSEKDSGVRVGPKAGELGRLRRIFPERVADAVVMPFGLFVQHVDRTPASGQLSPLGRLRRAYALAARMEEQRATPYLLAELARFRAAVAELPFVDGFAGEVEQALARLAPDGACVFVRSDTNVEDLKDFTGAGLNLTVPNQCGSAAVLAAIRLVWASPFGERSFHWRQKLLTNPEAVYPSVILQLAVASEISGVMVTTDLETGDERSLTISASEGVAAVVDGGAPETVVRGPDGALRLLASSRSATRKVLPLPPQSGLVVEPALGRDPLLSDAALVELGALADEVRRQAPPAVGAPWDIEFGLVAGKAFLFQLRPLRAARAPATYPFLVELDAQAMPPVMELDLSASLP